MAGKNNRFGSGEISNMLDFSHGPNRPLLDAWDLANI